MSSELKCFFPPGIALSAWLGTCTASEVYSKRTLLGLKPWQNKVCQEAGYKPALLDDGSYGNCDES